MAQPVGTAVIRAQQSFEVVGGLNLIKNEIEDDRILNILKKYKDIIHEIPPLGLLFSAPIKNDTNQIFVTSKELNGVKKSILNGKVYYLLSMIDVNEINSWKEIKSQSI